MSSVDWQPHKYFRQLMQLKSPRNSKLTIQDMFVELISYRSNCGFLPLTVSVKEGVFSYHTSSKRERHCLSSGDDNDNDTCKDKGRNGL